MHFSFIAFKLKSMRIIFGIDRFLDKNFENYWSVKGEEGALKYALATFITEFCLSVLLTGFSLTAIQKLSR